MAGFLDGWIFGLLNLAELVEKWVGRIRLHFGGYGELNSGEIFESEVLPRGPPPYLGGYGEGADVYRILPIFTSYQQKIKKMSREVIPAQNRNTEDLLFGYATSFLRRRPRPARALPSNITVVPPSGTVEFAAEKLNTPSASSSCVLKLKVPTVGVKPLPEIVPVPETTRNGPTKAPGPEEIKSKVNPPTDHNAACAPDVNVHGAVIVTAVPTATLEKSPLLDWTCVFNQEST